MSNSKHVSHTRISPNSSPRTAKIDKITIHHMAGNLSVETCGNVFASTSRQASSNYGVGSDGRIALYVDESRRAWTSSNRDNDNRAVTIEVANDSAAPNWHVSDTALAATIDLCVDICKRNGIKEIIFTGSPSGNLTMHRYFANTQCPGPYLGSKFPYIATEVNKRLGVSGGETNEETKPNTGNLKVGDVVRLAPAAKYTTGKSCASFLYKKKIYVRDVRGDNITISIYKTGDITGVVNKKYIIKDSAGTTPTPSQCPYTVKVTGPLDIHSGAGNSYKVTGVIKTPGIFTIVKEENGFGKLKSGAGWIHLASCQKVGV